MGNIFSVEIFDNKIDYFFSRQHFIILFISLIIIIFCSMYALRQNEKFQRRFVLIGAILLLLFEIGRIFWRVSFVNSNNLEKSFANIFNLDPFTLSLWISLPLIFVCAIRRKKDKKCLLLNFVFSVTMIIAVMNLIYPTGVNDNFEFYHFYNLCFLLLRSIAIMLGIFFAFAKWINVSEFLDLWKCVISLLIFGTLCAVISFIFGADKNLFYASYVPFFEMLGIHLGFPFN